MKLIETLKEKFWNNKILSEKQKEYVYFNLKGLVKGSQNRTKKENSLRMYIEELLEVQELNNMHSINYPKCMNDKEIEQHNLKLIAYYLPQYYPDEHNTKWWGRGSTEWTNVSKSLPQYLGHYQPRLPAEMGYYDLRIMDNIYRQIELAKIYGIYGFCFYYYWFDGERLLDLPLENFIKDNEINFPFCISWINESWTKQWSGASNTVLIEQTNDIESYKRFIKDASLMFSKKNYVRINNKPLLCVYRPNKIPDVKNVIDFWRTFVKQHYDIDIYIVATITHSDDYNINYIERGFDAAAEFSPGPHLKLMKNITNQKEFVCKNFKGTIYDYKDFIINKKYLTYKKEKVYRALCPMWDNTSRKKDKGTILDGATPALYKIWLNDISNETINNKSIDDNIIFVNAWNEWAEGTYLEPDLKWKYEYLEATKEVIEYFDDEQILRKR